MARILHTADLHLGLRTWSWPDPATGIPSRILDVGRAWHRVCDLAVERQVDLVIVAGDVFHGRDPDAVSLNLFGEGLRVLAGDGIPAVIIPGNHDGAQVPGRPSILEVFDGPEVDVVTRPEVRTIAGVTVATLPWVSRQQLVAAHPTLTRLDSVQGMAGGLGAILDSFRGDPSIDVLVGHWSIQGSLLGNEKDIAIVGEGEVVLPQADLEGPWRYAAFGHIHGAQAGKVGDTTWVYSGSVDRMNFGEEHEPKGVWIIDTEQDASEFVEIPARRFVTVEYTDDWSDYGDDTDVEGAIVRIRGKVAEGHDPAQAYAHARYLQEAGAALVTVQVEVVRETRARAEKVTSALELDDAMAEWFALCDVDVDEASAIRELVRELEEPVVASVPEAQAVAS